MLQRLCSARSCSAWFCGKQYCISKIWDKHEGHAILVADSFKRPQNPSPCLLMQFPRMCTNSPARHFSTESFVHSIATVPSSLFKVLSESTVVGSAKDLLVYVHEITGLPWWASIVLSTVILRSCVTLPLAMYQNYILAKVENIQLEMPEIVKELKKETAYAVKKFNWTERHARYVYNRSLKKQWNALVIRDNCHPFKASLLIWIQLPMWIILSAALRNMVYMLPYNDTAAQLLCLELSLGGFLWIPNLTIPDSSLVLPVMLGITNLAIIELQALSKLKQPGKLQKYVSNFFRILSVLLVPIAASVPSCLCVYWVTSSIFGLGQNLLLLSPRVKRLVGIPESPSTIKQPYQHIAQMLKERTEKLSWRK